MLKGDLTGIITLSNKGTGEMFMDEDLSLLSALANQVSLTIEYVKAMKVLSDIGGARFKYGLGTGCGLNA